MRRCSRLLESAVFKRHPQLIQPDVRRASEHGAGPFDSIATWALGASAGLIECILDLVCRLLMIIVNFLNTGPVFRTRLSVLQTQDLLTHASRNVQLTLVSRMYRGSDSGFYFAYYGSPESVDRTGNSFDTHSYELQIPLSSSAQMTVRITGKPIAPSFGEIQGRDRRLAEQKAAV